MDLLLYLKSLREDNGRLALLLLLSHNGCKRLGVEVQVGLSKQDGLGILITDGLRDLVKVHSILQELRLVPEDPNELILLLLLLLLPLGIHDPATIHSQNLENLVPQDSVLLSIDQDVHVLIEVIWQAAGLYVIDMRVITKDHGFETLYLLQLAHDFSIVFVILEPLDIEIPTDIVLFIELL